MTEAINHQPPTSNIISCWLKFCIMLVVFMIALGGYTRLSGSGLSITEWKLIHGVIPPINQQEWQEEFAAYQTIPQYSAINQGMKLEEFKIIFWPEYLHRLLGRIIGIVFLIPLLIFSYKKIITPKETFKLLAIFSLGGLQGAIGWYMVSSGLSENIYVSHLRLALHLMLALLLLGLLLWTLLHNSGESQNPALLPFARKKEHLHHSLLHVLDSGFRRNDIAQNDIAQNNIAYKGFIIYFLLLLVQIFYGALTAGLKAGFIYNSWPYMNGELLPASLSFSIYSIFNDHTAVQFIHRWLAAIVTISFYLWWFYNRKYVKNNDIIKLSAAIAFIIAAQFMLGVLTLINTTPLELAMIHQINAVLLFMLNIIMLNKLKNRAI